MDENAWRSLTWQNIGTDTRIRVLEEVRKMGKVVDI